MANVHGFNDLNHREAPRQAGGAYAGAPIPDSIPFMSKPADRAPLDETIPYTIKIICFPDLKLLSLTILITFVIWVLYILCCCLGINTAKGVLTIDDSVMLRLGAADW